MAMRNLLLIGIFFSGFFLNAQETKRIMAYRCDTPVKIDGKLEDACWQRAEAVCDFHQNFPTDTSPAYCETLVRMMYDDFYIYIAAECRDGHPGELVISSLKRDFDFEINDAFAFYLDPFNDQTNGYSFAVNAEGVQREGLLVNGGAFGSSTDWDCKWFAETSREPGMWIAEMAIPLKSIKYRSSELEWRVNFARNDMRANERSAWQFVPMAYPLQTLSNTGIVEWSAGPPDQLPAVALIPYSAGSALDDYSDNESADVMPNAGLDARLTVLKSLNLDLTINPDFSQADVDQQVTNLSRFSLFFPERRTFFLENNDLFGMFGFSQIRPFFSRRIGLFEGQTVPILGGMRLSGKLNRNWRVGFMNMQTEGNGALGLKAQNYTVGTFQRRVGTRSSIGGILVNRQAFAGNDVDYGDFNRIVGIDYNLLSKRNRWMGKFFYHHSFSPNLHEESYAHASFLRYADNHWSIMWNHEYVGKNYRADVGFVPRIENFDPETGTIDYRSYWRLEPEVVYTWYPKKTVFQAISHTAYLSHYLSESFSTTESRFNLRTEFVFRNQAYLGAGVIRNFTQLFYPFDVTGQNGSELPAGNYTFDLMGIWFESSPSKLLTWSGSIEIGQYFTGTNNQVSGEIGYRLQPYGAISASAQYNQIRLPNPYSDADLWLIGPKIDMAFTRQIFFTTFIQYNTQVNNININSRIQWRFKPMSDLFIVYTDNYDSRIFGIKNRALVLKLTYWLNL